MEQPFDVIAWLGPAADDTSAEQRDQITAAEATIAARWPHPDLTDSRELALSAAAQVILGDDTLESITTAWQEARRVERDAHAAATGAIIAAVGLGESESGVSARTGVTRVTVRKALGKA